MPATSSACPPGRDLLADLAPRLTRPGRLRRRAHERDAPTASWRRRSATGSSWWPPAALVEELREVKDDGRAGARSRAAAELADAVLRARRRARPGRAAPSARWRWTSSTRCARRGARGPVVPVDRGRRAPTARCRTPSRATCEIPRRHAGGDRLGCAAGRLLLGLHAHVRHRASWTTTAARGLRPGAAARSRPRLDAVRARARRARRSTPPRATLIDEAGPRRAVRPRAGPRRGAGGARGPAAGQDRRGRAAAPATW